jgi:hypothetical protein
MTSSARANDRPACEQVTSSGASCKARALPGSRFCFSHEPQLAAKRAEGRKRGGRERSRPARTLPEDAEEIICDSVGDVTRVLAMTLADVRKGRVDVKVGNCIAVLSTALLKSLSDGDLADELAALRREIEEMRFDDQRHHAHRAEAPESAPGGAAANGVADPRPDSPRPGGDIRGGRDEAGPLATDIAPLAFPEALVVGDTTRG